MARIGGVLRSLRSLSWVCWQPGWDTLVAVATVLYMIPSYYLSANLYHPLTSFNFMFTDLVINVLLPAYYVLKVCGESSEHLGLTKRRWLPSLLISAALATFFSLRMIGFLATVPQELVLSTVVFNGIILWEPFFVYSWLQLRFERAFGILPGIILAGACFGSYHTGTYPPQMVVMLALFGMFYGAVFRLTKNLLALWPLTWAVASTMGTVSGVFTFGWDEVWTYSAILLLQGLGIWWLVRTRSRVMTVV